jgi:hypothetical protein
VHEQYLAQQQQEQRGCVHRPRPRQRRASIVVWKSSKGRWSAVRQRSGREEEEEEEECRQRIVERVSQTLPGFQRPADVARHCPHTSTLARTRCQSRRNTLSSVRAVICGSWSRVSFSFSFLLNPVQNHTPSVLGLHVNVFGLTFFYIGVPARPAVVGMSAFNIHMNMKAPDKAISVPRDWKCRPQISREQRPRVQMKLLSRALLL